MPPRALLNVHRIVLLGLVSVGRSSNGACLVILRVCVCLNDWEPPLGSTGVKSKQTHEWLSWWSYLSTATSSHLHCVFPFLSLSLFSTRTRNSSFSVLYITSLLWLRIFSQLPITISPPSICYHHGSDGGRLFLIVCAITWNHLLYFYFYFFFVLFRFVSFRFVLLCCDHHHSDVSLLRIP